MGGARNIDASTTEFTILDGLNCAINAFWNMETVSTYFYI